MSGFPRLVLVGTGVVATVGVLAFSVVEWRSRLIELNASDARFREQERSRRAQRPADTRHKPYRSTYDQVFEGKKIEGISQIPRSAEPMPPTSCCSVEAVPKRADNPSEPARIREDTLVWVRGGDILLSKPARVHADTVTAFEEALGFGKSRFITRPSEVIDRFELVSLLTEDEPSVYVLDEMPTPALARKAKRRPLDEFERLGLRAVRRGEDVVWTPEAPKRMFGAIRTSTQCLDCHVNAKEGDLLGAFTYYLKTPVDELAKHNP